MLRHPELLDRLRVCGSVVVTAGHVALVGEQPAREDGAVLVESCGALCHPALLLEVLDSLLLGASREEVLHKAWHAQERMLGHPACEVSISLRELALCELLVHAVGVQEILSGEWDVRVRVLKPDELPVRSIEYWLSVEEDAPSCCHAL